LRRTPARSRTLAVAEHFGCKARFAAPDCSLAISRDILARSPHTANAPLFEFLSSQARAQLARHGSEDVVTQSRPRWRRAAARCSASSPRRARAIATCSHVRARRSTELARAGVAEPQIATQLGFPMHGALDD
jgi:hypothetical protein